MPTASVPATSTGYSGLSIRRSAPQKWTYGYVFKQKKQQNKYFAIYWALTTKTEIVLKQICLAIRSDTWCAWLTCKSESILRRLRNRLLSMASPFLSRSINRRMPSMVLVWTFWSLIMWVLNSSRPISLWIKTRCLKYTSKEQQKQGAASSWFWHKHCYRTTSKNAYENLV